MVFCNIGLKIIYFLFLYFLKEVKVARKADVAMSMTDK